jgi:hypothetical protein
MVSRAAVARLRKEERRVANENKWADLISARICPDCGGDMVKHSASPWWKIWSPVVTDRCVACGHLHEWEVDTSY